MCVCLGGSCVSEQEVVGVLGFNTSLKVVKLLD